MKAFISMLTLFLVTYLPAIDACRQKRIEFIKAKPCAEDYELIEKQCLNITTELRKYGESIGRVYGSTIEYTPACQDCQGANTTSCSCTITAWRFREWMHEPPIDRRPKLTNGWDYVDKNNGQRGWVDLVGTRSGYLH
ncbi:predicted protein [Plenodomus lingam JN3]|uniref:Predicted protein n=1 Tax=Leptosphaeria maculans (strain JN3 / isolate v23.1.3 / race Av1-4-5-6-7-8) TaxID=985895 RepID=E4ZIG1_LEPMJ|nr:predicted protein [Plenodomus lingam JN3]CBX90982.1 predicted protein [Plenodomus lingam JN3]